jgi:hypothetical protein
MRKATKSINVVDLTKRRKKHTSIGKANNSNVHVKNKQKKRQKKLSYRGQGR